MISTFKLVHQVKMPFSNLSSTTSMLVTFPLFFSPFYSHDNIMNSVPILQSIPIQPLTKHPLPTPHPLLEPCYMEHTSSGAQPQLHSKMNDSDWPVGTVRQQQKK